MEENRRLQQLCRQAQAAAESSNRRATEEETGDPQGDEQDEGGERPHDDGSEQP